MRRIVEQREAAAIGESLQAAHVARVAVHVRRQQAAGALADESGSLLDVQIEGVRIDVAEHRRQPGPLDRVHRGGKRERRRDHLALDLEGAQRRQERHGRVAEAGAEAEAQAVLEALHHLAVIGEPAAAHDARQELDERGLIGKAWSVM